MIRAENVTFDYESMDEEGNVESRKRAVNHVNLEIQSAHTSLSQSLEQVRLTGNSLSKACDNERMAQERYEEGKVSIVEVIEAKNYRQSSQINYVQAKVSAQNYYSDLVKALHKY
jgi:outer membrane protein TolC